MPNFELSVVIEPPFVGLVVEDWLRRAMEITLAVAGVSAPVDVGLVIAGDDTVHNLNLSYRGIDDTTDVLSFAFCEPQEGEPFVVPQDEILHLGEVIISYPQAEKQAQEQRHPLERELALLIAHGVLHLLGYDHVEPEAEQTMKAMENKVLDTIL